MSDAEPLITQKFAAFDFHFGGPSLDQIVDGVRLLAANNVHWIGSTQINRAKYAVMVHDFPMDDEAPTATSSLMAFVHPSVDTSGPILQEGELCGKAAQVSEASGLPVVANCVNIPALLVKLHDKVLETVRQLREDPEPLQQATQALEERIISQNVYERKELDRLMALERARKPWEKAGTEYLLTFEDQATARSVATALEQEGFGTPRQDGNALFISVDQQMLLADMRLNNLTPRQRNESRLAK